MDRFTDSCVHDISVKVLKMEQTTDMFLGVLLVLFCMFFFVFQLRDVRLVPVSCWPSLLNLFCPLSYLSQKEFGVMGGDGGIASAFSARSKAIITEFSKLAFGVLFYPSSPCFLPSRVAFFCLNCPARVRLRAACVQLDRVSNDAIRQECQKREVEVREKIEEERKVWQTETVSVRFNGCGVLKQVLTFRAAPPDVARGARSSVGSTHDT